MFESFNNNERKRSYSINCRPDLIFDGNRYRGTLSYFTSTPPDSMEGVVPFEYVKKGTTIQKTGYRVHKSGYKGILIGYSTSSMVVKDQEVLGLVLVFQSGNSITTLDCGMFEQSKNTNLIASLCDPILNLSEELEIYVNLRDNSDAKTARYVNVRQGNVMPRFSYGTDEAGIPYGLHMKDAPPVEEVELSPGKVQKDGTARFRFALSLFRSKFTFMDGETYTDLHHRLQGESEGANMSETEVAVPTVATVVKSTNTATAKSNAGFETITPRDEFASDLPF